MLFFIYYVNEQFSFIGTLQIIVSGCGKTKYDFFAVTGYKKRKK